MEILDYYGIDCKGKNAVVIGRSLVVGKPAAMMLMAKNATVTVCHTKTVDVAGIARKADILVSAAGVLNSLTKDYVSEGQIVIDVSINWDPEKINSKGGKGAIAGDAVFSEVEPIVERHHAGPRRRWLRHDLCSDRPCGRSCRAHAVSTTNALPPARSGGSFFKA